MAIITPAAAANAYAALNRLGTDPTSLLRSGGDQGAGGPNFSSILKDVIGSVSEAGAKADVQANMVDVVTAVAESETAISTLVSVRDRVIAAYEDILKMPI
jgi:flagellar hook-basal body complex protein FliE